ncbi:hypothetical protein LDL36_13865 [Komagataeibacter sp. FNDCR1]|nr:hypothetical protein [Komagataeibacter sp. FNDCR1]
MPWIKIRISPFVWLKREVGPPPSCRVLFLHVSWFDWDTFAREAADAVEKYKRALDAARKELRK